MKTFKDFERQYPTQKVIRCELTSIGKTGENLKRSGLLEQDQHRAESYKKVKKIIDRYHKAYIDSALSDFHFKYEDDGKKDSLSEFFHYYHLGNGDEKRAEILKAISANLRKQIVRKLTESDKFKRINKKELIKEDLLTLDLSQEERLLIEEFNDFTTYFKGFNENRMNMYSDEEKTTAIAYRVIHENLPKFIDNIDIFSKIACVDEVQKGIKKLGLEYKEHLNMENIPKMFELDKFSSLLTQPQIDIYNSIIGGYVLDDGTKIQGLNEYINIYNQCQKDKHSRLPKLKMLYKQILSDKETISWLPEEFETDNDMLKVIREFYCDVSTLWHGDENETSLVDLLSSLYTYDLNSIYITAGLPLSSISKKLYGSWSLIQEAVENDFAETRPKAKNTTEEKYNGRKKKYFKSFNSFSIGYLNKCVAQLQQGEGENMLPTLETYFMGMGNQSDGKTLFDVIEYAFEQVKDLLNSSPTEHTTLSQDKVCVEKIKNLLDAIKNLQHFIKPLLGNGDESEKDERFYGEFSNMWEKLDTITVLYNKVRNRLTKRPYSDSKIKLNFNNSTLLDGWDMNKEKDNTCVLLRKKGLYYLAIMDKKHNKVFLPENLKSDGACYEKMDYKLLPGANKMLPKVFFAKSRIGEFAPSEELLENYHKGTHKKGPAFKLEDCHALIDFFKSSIQKHEDWKTFDFHFSETSSYQDISDFYREVEQQGYKITFRNVSEAYINSLVDEGKIYLFQIYNKDFSSYSKGTPNMHTLYWKMLFDERNLRDVVYKLNGEAEIFFRKSSLACNKPTHPANKPIANKNKLNKKRESVFSYDLIKDKRYTVDKFQFHVPITLNFKSTGNGNINKIINEYLKHAENVHVIGIDRGERNLLYVSLINMRGQIVKQFTLNEIINGYNGVKCPPTNYRDLLQTREKKRDEERKSWKTIESIKELKEGYLSQVVHVIAKLVVEHNAIVVLEDLNSGFMRGRQKVERQVYQKFERMLIDKFNYLVDKKADVEQAGGVLHALQLTCKFESFQKMGKQNGILFYIPAWNTSKIDPVTGFVNLFNMRYVNKSKACDFFKAFDHIGYNAEKKLFEFKFDYSKFTTKADGTRQNWTLCSYGTRIRTFRDSEKNSMWTSEEIVLTDEFKALFRLFHVPVSDNMKTDICMVDDATFYESLMKLLKLTLQMRNSRTGEDEDYIISPVTDENGVFFDSRNNGGSLPENADANGAYNIALKGLWALNQIKKADDVSKVKLSISNKEWLNYVQTKPYLKEKS